MHSSKNSLIQRHCTASVVCALIYISTAESQEAPPFSLTPQQRDALAAPVIDTFRSVDQQGGAALIDYLQSMSLGTIDQPEPSESAEAIAGTSLSKVFFGSQRAFDRDRLLEGVNLVRTNDEYKTSVGLCAAIEKLLHDESLPLVQWLVGRAANAPATRCDKVVLASLPTEFNGFGTAFWNGSRNSWRAMLTAKNPVYRLIALRNVSIFEPDTATQLANYQSGLNETNTLLQNAAFEGLKVIGTPAAKAALQSFLNQHRPANDGTMPDDFDINAAMQEYLTPSAP